MLQATTIEALGDALKNTGQHHNQIALVPTMGALHAGHITLIKYAQTLCEYVVVSIFVNPLQFNDQDDLAKYPRTFEADIETLIKHRISLLFSPSIDEMYKQDSTLNTTIQVPRLGDQYCGANRTGHFQGVATIVAKLFNLIQPDHAVFGAKDHQQFIIVKHMVEDLNFPVCLHEVATVREADGLALSSRNQRLTKTERTIAPSLYQNLQQVAEELRQGKDFTALKKQAEQTLTKAGFYVEYIALCDVDTLEEPRKDRQRMILVAVRLGEIRLIDNIRVD